MKKLCVLILCAALFAPNALLAGNSGCHAQNETPAASMALDALLIRPASLVATVVGTVTYVVTLPFSALGGNAGEAGNALVLEPAKYTFVRPLGC